MSPRSPTEPRVRHVALWLCEPCIHGEGDECHTPGCALYLHKVDLPIGEELIAYLDEPPTPEEIEEAETRAANEERWREGALNEAHADGYSEGHEDARLGRGPEFYSRARGEA